MRRLSTLLAVLVTVSMLVTPFVSAQDLASSIDSTPVVESADPPIEVIPEESEPADDETATEPPVAVETEESIPTLEPTEVEETTPTDVPDEIETDSPSTNPLAEEASTPGVISRVINLHFQQPNGSAAPYVDFVLYCSGPDTQIPLGVYAADDNGDISVQVDTPTACSYTESFWNVEVKSWNNYIFSWQNFDQDEANLVVTATLKAFVTMGVTLNGQPYANGVAELSVSDGAGGWISVYGLWLNESGTNSMYLDGGDYRLEVPATPLTPAGSKEFTVGAQDTQVTLPLTFASYSVTFPVSAPAGTDLLYVHIFDDNGHQVDRSIDAQGSTIVSGLVPGQYTYSIDGDSSLVTAKGEFTVVDADLVLDQITITPVVYNDVTVNITTDDANSHRGVSVWLESTDGTFTAFGNVDEGNTAHLAGLPTGTYNLHVSDHGIWQGISAQVEVSPESTTFTYTPVVDSSIGRIRVHLVTERPEGIPDQAVCLRDQSTNGSVYSMCAYPDENGRLTFYAPIGETYLLQSSAYQHFGALYEVFAISEGNLYFDREIVWPERTVYEVVFNAEFADPPYEQSLSIAIMDASSGETLYQESLYGDDTVVFYLAAGDYEYSYNAYTYLPQSALATFTVDTSGHAPITIHPVPMPQQSFTFNVVPEEGDDISGATLCVSGYQYECQQVGSDNKVVFPALIAGDQPYYAWLSTWGAYPYLETSVTVGTTSSPYTITWEPTGETLPVTFSLTTNDGNDTTARVNVYRIDDDSWDSFTIEELHTGQPISVPLVPGSYQYYAYSNSDYNQPAGTFNVSEGEQEVNILMQTVRSYYGTVSVLADFPDNSSGEPVRIWFTNVVTNQVDGPYSLSEEYPYPIDLVTGTYTWRAEGAWYFPVVSDEPITIVRDQTTSISFSLQSKSVGAAQLNITMDPVPANYYERAICIRSVVDNWHQCDNYFLGQPILFDNLPEGQYNVYIPTWQLYLSQVVPVTVVAGETAQVDINWPGVEGAAVTFNLVWPAGEPELDVTVAIYYEDGTNVDSVQFWPGTTSVTAELPYGTHTYFYYLYGYEDVGPIPFTVTEGGSNIVTISPMVADEDGGNVTFHIEPSRSGDSLESAYACIHGWMGSRCVRVDASNNADFGTMPPDYYQLELFDFSDYPYVYPASAVEVVSGGGDVAETVVWQAPTEGTVTFNITLPGENEYDFEYIVNLRDEHGNSVDGFYAWQPGTKTYSVTVPGGNYTWSGSGYRLQSLSGAFTLDDGENEIVVVAPQEIEMGTVQFNVTMPEGETDAQIQITVSNQAGEEIAAANVSSYASLTFEPGFYTYTYRGLGIAPQGPFDFEIVANDTTEINITPQMDAGLPAVTLAVTPSVTGDSLQYTNFCLYTENYDYSRCSQLDEQGRYSFGHLPSGNYDLELWMTDSLYRWQTFSVTIPEDVDAYEITATMQKTSGARITFSPQMPEGVWSITVDIFNENDDLVRTFSTWGENRSFNLVTGTYHFSVSGLNVQDSTGTFVVQTEQNKTVPIEVTRVPGAFMEIKVTSSAGYDLADNRVCIGTPETGYSECSYVDSDGMADLGYLPAGPLAITLVSNDVLHVVQPESITVPADGEHHQIAFTWQAVDAEEVTFNVTMPMGSNTVHIDIWSVPAEAGGEVLSGGSLEFTQSGSQTVMLPAGSYTYQVWSSHYYSQLDIPFTVISNDQNIVTVPQLVPMPKLTIHVTGNNGVSLAGHYVCIGQVGWVAYCATSDVDGNVVFWPDSGTWWARIDASGVYLGTTVDEIELGSVDVVQEVSLSKMAEYGTFSVDTSAVQAEFGEIRVNITNNDSSYWYGVTIPQGAVTAIELPIGTYQWEVWMLPYDGDYFSQTGTITLVDHGTASAVVTPLQQKPLVSIRLVDADGQPVPDIWLGLNGIDNRYEKTDNDGMINVRVAPGDYTVEWWDETASVYRNVPILVGENGYVGQITMVANPVVLSLSATSGKAGSTVTLTGSGFVASSSVDISFGGTVVKTTTASSAGTISVSLTIPVTSTVRSYTIAAIGSGDRTGVLSYNVTALADVSATINSPTGQAGKNYVISGQGFLPGQQVTVRWGAVDGLQLAVLTPTSTGGIGGIVTIPVTTPKGIYTLYVTSASGQSTTISFEVVQLASVTASMSPPTGQAGKTYTINGQGFLPGQQVVVRWNTADGTQLATLTPTSTGSISGSVTIPMTATKGIYTLYVTSASGQSTMVAFEVTQLAGVSATISSSSGQAGKIYTINGEGFLPGQQVTVRWNTVDGPQLAALTPTSTGGISGSVTIPVLAAKGAYTLYISSASGQSTTVEFSVTTLADVSATISSPTGQAGKTYTISGEGFLPGQQVTIRWNASNGIQLATLTSTSTGSISGSVTIPVLAAKGAYALYVTSASGQSTTIAFEVTQLADVTATLSAQSLQAGELYMISGEGFLPGQQVTVRWNAADGTQLATLTPTSTGGITGSVTIPVTTALGTYMLYVTSASGQSTTITVEVQQLADVSATIISPTGQAGKVYTISGEGFLPGQQVTVRWNATNGIQLATLTPTSTGSISGSITIPTLAAKGAYTLYVTSASGQSTTVAFSVATLADVTATISSPIGQAGKTYTISGEGFLPGQQVTVRWNATNGAQLATLTPTSTGSISGSLTIPILAAKGAYTLYVTSTSGQSATVTFSVATLADVTATVSSPTGQAGKTYTINGEGFLPGQQVTVRWNATNGTQLATLTPTSTGSISGSVTIPVAAAKGAYTLYVTSASGQSATVSFTVDQLADVSVTLSVTSGQAGTVTKVSGSGFQPSEAITIRWGGSSGTVLRTFNAGTTGKFTANITVPQNAAKASYEIYVSAASGLTGSATYTVTQLAGASITLSVTSGQAGTVTKVSGTGFMPSEAITIRWGGSSGTVLRTFNAGTSGKFTANITVPQNSAKQAYVVYASGTSGRNASATYTVTSLISASITLSVTSGQAGTVTKVTGTGFMPSEAITIRWGGSSGTVLRTFNAGTSGKFTANITVPQNSAKQAYVVYASGTSGQNASATYTVTSLISASITLSVTSGQAGTVTKVTGAGFMPSEAITIRWGGSSGTVLRTFNAGTTGKFTANITVPATSAKQTYVVYASGTSGQNASATYTVTSVVSASITLSVTSGKAGTTTKVSGSGFVPSEAITIRWAGSSGTVLRTFNAGTTGKFTANITIPKTATLGGYQVYVSSASGQSGSASYTVTALALMPIWREDAVA